MTTTLNGLAIHLPFVTATEFSIMRETDRIDASILNDWRPDLEWSAVDKAGHFHTFDEDGNLPTLNAKSVDVPCDGSCGGACRGEGTIGTVYRCKICNKKVKPQWKNFGPTYQTIPGLTRTTIKLRAAEFPCGLGDELTFRIDHENGHTFGIGRVVDLSFGSASIFDAVLDVSVMAHRKTTLPGLAEVAS